MIEIREEEEKKVRALLVGEPGVDLGELEGLVTTLGMEIVRSFSLTRLEESPAYGMGSGKAKEISTLASELQAECIIFDFEISPRRQRNWEKLAKIPVFDRQEVILRIFAQRSRTKEAVLQVELARLSYSLPRLAHMYGDMARQRGGSYGSKGSGEKQLELDQRQVRERIKLVKKELAQVVNDRETQRKRRERIPLPSCALVGYTNAGKSSLLNALTGADVFVEDKLFATLDPTTRRLTLKTGGSILLTDTVGFISHLPHSLIDAFKSTLEEAARADLLLLVLDASDPNVKSQYETVISVLEEIGADTIPKLIVLNKCDLLSDEDSALTGLFSLFDNPLTISAKNHAGFEELSEGICRALLGSVRSFVLPTASSQLLNVIREQGIIIDQQWLDDGVHVKARLGREEDANGEERENNRLLALLKPYLID